MALATCLDKDPALHKLVLCLVDQNRARNGKFEGKYAMSVFAALHEFPLGMFLKGLKISDGSSIDRVVNALSQAWVTRTRSIRTVAQFDARVSQQLKVAMGSLDMWLHHLTSNSKESVCAIIGKWHPPGAYQVEGWSVRDGDGASITVAPDHYEGRLALIDAPEHERQAFSDGATAFMRTLWDYGWEMCWSRLMYTYRGRQIVNMRIRKQEGEEEYDLAELLLRLGLVYPYYKYLWGDRNTLHRLMTAAEEAFNAASRQPIQQSCVSFLGGTTDDEDLAAQTEWTQQEFALQRDIARIVTMQQYTMESNRGFNRVKPKLVFGPNVDAPLAVKIDIAFWHAQPDTCNLWDVHTDSIRVVNTRFFPEDMRKTWGFNTKKCYLAQWPQEAKMDRHLLNGRTSERLARRRAETQGLLRSTNRRDGRIVDDENMEEGAQVEGTQCTQSTEATHGVGLNLQCPIDMPSSTLSLCPSKMPLYCFPVFIRREISNNTT
eukprot:1180224-Prorocentrum_minimum.AAC.1